jgi:DNA-binding XRE family transcriptional regulator
MLRLNLMARSQAEALVSFLGARLRPLVGRDPGQLLQKDVAKAAGVSTATISDLKKEKVKGMRLSTVEAMTNYFRLSLLEALQLASQASTLSAPVDADPVREGGIARLRGLLNEETIAFVRGLPAAPGRNYSEFDWVKVAVLEEESTRLRARIVKKTPDTMAAEGGVEAAHETPAKAANENEREAVEAPPESSKMQVAGSKAKPKKQNQKK